MKQIVILGTAPSSINLAPLGSPDWEIWACSPGTYHLKDHIDRFFELHRWEPGVSWFPPGYVEFLRNFEGPVMMTAKVESVKNCTLLDVDGLVAKYGPYFFTSSIAWMIAMAIEEGADKIALYGVDMGASTEYKDQRLGCQYMCMVAKSLGIEVGVPPESDLLRPAPLYGVCEQSHGWIKQTARNKELIGRLTEAQNIVAERSKEIDFLNGCLDDQDWTLQSFFGNVDTLGTKYCEPVDVPVIKGVIAEPRIITKE